MFEIGKYFGYALYILKTNTIIMWSVVLMGVATGLGKLFIDDGADTSWLLIGSVIKLSIFAVVYGMCYELVIDRYTSVTEIGKKYILPFLWLFLNMYVPAVLVAILPGMLVPGLGGEGVWMIIMMSFGILYLYVIPWFYISGSWRGAIVHGITFLLKNLNASTVIIMLALLTELGFVCLDIVLGKIKTLGGILYFALDAGVFVADFLVNCLFFIILVYIIKERVQGIRIGE